MAATSTEAKTREKLRDLAASASGGGLTLTTNLTGTVAKTAASATLAGTGTQFQSELAVGDSLIVPGTQSEVRRVQSIASDTSLTVADAFTYSASGQTAQRVRVYLGIDDLAANNSILSSLTSGPYLSIGPALPSDFDSTTCYSRFDVDCELWFGAANDADYTFTDIEDFIFANSTGLRAKWLTISNYTSGEGVPPARQITFSKPEMRTDLKPMIGVYRMTLRFNY